MKLHFNGDERVKEGWRQGHAVRKREGEGSHLMENAHLLVCRLPLFSVRQQGRRYPARLHRTSHIISELCKHLQIHLGFNLKGLLMVAWVPRILSGQIALRLGTACEAPWKMQERLWKLPALQHFGSTDLAVRSF